MTEVLQVDVSNPGQVLACLGLIEVLDLIAVGSEGGFISEREFRIDSDSTVAEALASVAKAIVREERLHTEPPPWRDSNSWPVMLEGRFGSLVLDPWLLPDHSKLSKGLKLWAGRVRTLELFRGLAQSLPTEAPTPVRTIFERAASGTPTGLDPRSAVSREDLGFSYNDQSLKPLIFPVVDTFAMIGLRSARPIRTGRLTYAYHLWDDPLPPILARAALTGHLPTEVSSRWVYKTESRGRGGTYRYLSHATPEETEP